MDKITGIYSIKNKINGKIYIGKSVDIYKRWTQHKLQLRKNEHHSKSLQADWNKYGEDAFEFSIVEECKTEKLNKMEYDNIIRYSSYINGYNEVEGSSDKRAKLSRLSVGDIFTYKELCDYVCEKPQKSGKYLRYQIREWQRYIGLKIKDGQFYISEKYDVPLEIKKKILNASKYFERIIKNANYDYKVTENGYTTLHDLVEGLHLFQNNIIINNEVIQRYFSCLTKAIMTSIENAMFSLNHSKDIKLKTGLVITYAYGNNDISIGVENISNFHYIAEKSCESFLRKYYPEQIGASSDYLYTLRFENPNDYEIYKNNVICNMQNNEDFINEINNKIHENPPVDNANIILDYNLGYKIDFSKKRIKRKDYDELISDFKKSVVRYAVNILFHPIFGWYPERRNDKDIINELREFNKKLFSFDDEELDEIFPIAS